MNQIDNLFNVKYMEQSSISLSKIVLLFYLVIANNYTNNLLSHQFRDFMKDNRYAQHFIGYLTMLVLISIVGGVTDPTLATTYSLIAYLWFIFTTKLDLSWNLLIIGIMVFFLLYENTMLDKEVRSESDQALEEQDKEKIKNRHNRLKALVVVAILIITIIGGSFYLNKQIVQHGGDFDGVTYVFG